MAYDVAGLPKDYFNPGELEVFLGLIEQHRPSVVVEFGVNRGRNAAAVLRNFDFVERYVGIDVEPGYVTAMECQRREVPSNAGELAAHDPRFELILRPRGSYDLLPRDLPRAQFYFVDGDHSREGVLNDHYLCVATAAPGPGAVILFHDDNGSPKVQVSETLDELRGEGRDIRHIPGTWFAVEVLE